MTQLRIGTCSWKYPSWSGLVYSAERGIDYLAQYGQRYNTVEIDQWFWSLFGEDKVKLPAAEDAASYRQSVGSDFRFSVKVPNSITLTHFYQHDKSSTLTPNPHYLSVELWHRFIGQLEPLGETLGPLILQFEYLNQEKMSSQKQFQQQLGEFFAAIRGDHTLAVEVRNPRFFNQGWFDFLAEQEVYPVLLQGYWLPSIVSLFREWRKELLRQRLIVIRLHGGDRREIEQRTGKRWDSIVEPRDQELVDIAGIINELRDSDVEVYLNVNNHYEGAAPLTIERFSRVLRP
ncbi:MAG: DUF72 domain-containing protein [Candidatus Delongbacteria bacterium]|nr:DUF72 domain-containing protein [bacterium]MBL7033638.1 DUF72 domain-containing protein [Candidatus Delongbacteria bacterium]